MKALIVVDLQNDFVEGGPLAAQGGRALVPVINRLQRSFDLIVATQDWHPANHGSFASNHPGHQPGEVIDLHGLPQVLWRDHCVQGTSGAEFVAGLERGRWAGVFVKGTDPEIDSYSGFFDNGHRKSTGLGDFLKKEGVTEVYVAGLDTDYCVKFTALDAHQLGFVTYLIEDASCGVELKPGDVQRAIEEMQSAGVRVIQSADVLGFRREEVA